MSNAHAAPAMPPAVMAIREALAGAFAAEIEAAIAPAIEWLEKELARTEDRAKWKPLREAKQHLEAFRREFLASIGAKVRERFDAKIDRDSDQLSKTAMFSLDSLKLVEDAEMQEEISIGKSAKRLKEKSGEELVALTRRLAAAMQVNDLPDDRNPAFPRIFSRAVMESFKAVGCDSPTALAAFDAIDSQLPRIARSVYASVNKKLDAGPSAPGAAPQDALARSIAARPAPGAGRAHGTRDQPSGADAGELFRRLIATPAVAVLPDEVPQSGGDGLVTVRMRPDELERMRQLAGAGGVAADARSAPASAADPTIAELVGAVFTRLDTDPRLDAGLRAQLSRLRPAVLSIAAADTSFFLEAEHPARRLIDRICELGMGGPAAMPDGRHASQAIDAIVDAIIAKPAQREDFTSASTQLDEIFTLVEETAATQDGSLDAARRAESADLALQAASIEVLERLAGHPNALEVAAFLQEAWKAVLMHDYVSEGGPTGEAWHEDLRTLEDLMWTLKPQPNKAEFDRMVKALPSLIGRLKHGLARIHLDAARTEEFLSKLQALHQQRLRTSSQIIDEGLTDIALEQAASDTPVAATLLGGSTADDAGIVRGAWLDFTRAPGETMRCRITWIAGNRNICLLRDYASKASFAMSVAELRARLADGSVTLVEGIGVAREAIDAAVAELARRRGAV